MRRSLHASSAWDGPRGAALDDVSLAVHAVRAGGAMASSYFGRTIAVTSKSQRSDVVSEADLTVERFLVGLLHERRPADGVLAEEGSSRPGARTWVLDPLDGTQNFVRGDGYWCTAIALTDERGTAVSAIHHPTTGDTYWAVRGAGAWCNGQRLVVPPDCPLESAQLAAFLDTGGNDLQVLAAVVARFPPSGRPGTPPAVRKPGTSYWTSFVVLSDRGPAGSLPSRHARPRDGRSNADRVSTPARDHCSEFT